MKLLMIYTNKFAYKTNIRNLDSVKEYEKNEIIENAVVGFIQIEEKDEEDISKTETKIVKNMKWVAKKNDTKKIVLHSFAHLSLSKADEKITRDIFDSAEERLIKSGYEVSQTPFGYFLDLDIKAPGESLARVFKEF